LIVFIKYIEKNIEKSFKKVLTCFFNFDIVILVFERDANETKKNTEKVLKRTLKIKQ